MFLKMFYDVLPLSLKSKINLKSEFLCVRF